MSKQCALIKRPLDRLRGAFIEVYHAKCVRVIRQGESQEKIHGLLFNCPKCMSDKAHAIPLLFDLVSVPSEALPAVRYRLEKFTPNIVEVTLHGEVKSPYCDWKGFVVNGRVSWKQ